VGFVVITGMIALDRLEGHEHILTIKTGVASYKEEAVMTGTSKVVGSSSLAAARHERWLAARDILGGGLLLAAVVAIWTVTWASVAGPLRPAEAVRADSAAQVARVAQR
jgi:hypothetical protein